MSYVSVKKSEEYILYFLGFSIAVVGLTNMIMAFMDKSKFDRPKKLRLTNAAFIILSGISVFMIPFESTMYSAGAAFLALGTLILSMLVTFKVV